MNGVDWDAVVQITNVGLVPVAFHDPAQSDKKYIVQPGETKSIPFNWQAENLQPGTKGVVEVVHQEEVH